MINFVEAVLQYASSMPWAIGFALHIFVCVCLFFIHWSCVLTTVLECVCVFIHVPIGYPKRSNNEVLGYVCVSRHVCM